ncbi:MAG: hypothetical protein MI975_07580 [Cytophagales bacterium]|nr:hypothetical protein [Cytophagales bacterium]
MKRFAAISLLLIFIAGQVNLTWATHYCGKFAVERLVSLGVNKSSCCMEEENCCDENICCDDKTIDAAVPTIISEECCSNDYFSSNTDDFFIKSESGNNAQILFVAAYVSSLHKHVDHPDFKRTQTKEFSFLIAPDKQVFYQTFLL